jgi:sugar-specific transcriptional regulator TrmB
MQGGLIEKLIRIGFSEYEARAYIALLKDNPVTGDMLAQLCGIPCSLGSRIAEQLVERGAAVTLPTERALTYAPIPADELLDRLQQEYADIIATIKEDLRSYASPLDPNPVWNIAGESNILARAATMIHHATKRIVLAALPAALDVLRPALQSAIDREVQVVVYATGHVDLPGGRVIVSSYPEAQLECMSGVGLILIIDGQEALIGEWLAPQRAQASWTRGPTLVSIAEQHLVRGGRRRFPVSAEANHREGRNAPSMATLASRGTERIPAAQPGTGRETS